MPGKIVRVLVAAGQQVSAGQGLLVIEAMKMQNEIRSPKSGTVEKLAREGQTVNAGEVLAVVTLVAQASACGGWSLRGTKPHRLKPVLLKSQKSKRYFAGEAAASLAAFGVTTTGNFPADSTTCWAR